MTRNSTLTSRRGSGRRTGSGEIGRKILLEVVGAVVLIALTGCSTPPITDGRLPPTDNLSKLTIGVSGEDDVRKALGRPRGPGATRHGHGQPEFRTIWYYEYVQIKGDQIGLKILLVFFDSDKYDGYQWFSAKELIERGAF